MKYRLAVSRRAFEDLEQINSYSLKMWGEYLVEQNLERCELALNMIKANPGLLRQKPEWCEYLKFYRAGQFLLVFTQLNKTLYLLTVKHEIMNLVDRMIELEPTLSEEVKLMHRVLRRKMAGAAFEIKNFQIREEEKIR